MATDAELLAEAKTARHRLLTGTNVVSIGFGDERVEYRNFATDLDKLDAYIRDLEHKVGTVLRKPFGVQF